MSKLAKKPINLKDITHKYDNKTFTVNGKHGELSITIPDEVNLVISEDSELFVESKSSSYQGLYFSLIKNMIIGVTDLFSITLTLTGVGYRATLSDKTINLNLGYSHPVSYQLDDLVNVKIVSPTEILLQSCDKQLLGQTAANIIKLRPAKKDPYKFKGIKRTTDRILKKVGKKVK